MVKDKRLVIVGCGGTAELARDYFDDDSHYEVFGFAAEPVFLKGDAYLGLPLISIEDMHSQFPPSEFEAFVALAYGGLNSHRARLCEWCKEEGYTLASYVSSHTFVGRDVTIDENAFVMECGSLQHHVQIGRGATLWSGCQIEHLSSVGEYAWLAANVVVSGNCHIGERCFIGSNSTLMNDLDIPARNVIGAGSLVAESLQGEDKMYVSGNRLFPLDEHRYNVFAGIAD